VQQRRAIARATKARDWSCNNGASCGTCTRKLFRRHGVLVTARLFERLWRDCARTAITRLASWGVVRQQGSQFGLVHTRSEGQMRRKGGSRAGGVFGRLEPHPIIPAGDGNESQREQRVGLRGRSIAHGSRRLGCCASRVLLRHGLARARLMHGMRSQCLQSQFPIAGHDTRWHGTCTMNSDARGQIRDAIRVCKRMTCRARWRVILIVVNRFMRLVCRARRQTFQKR